MTRGELSVSKPPPFRSGMLLGLMERRYGENSTVFCTQFQQKAWQQRPGSGVHADAIMDRINHNTVWVDSGTDNMRR
ncbi:ATP-binding protein [Cryobacterium sp. Y82]|uniref:ATP-binding protein n=1 Tax=Cryobacterium sp. Y82 TaxID=2045017 RepID=UPI000CE421D6|nr:ATP-binding protein [Cryobacterium sp. Y82]